MADAKSFILHGAQILPLRDCLMRKILKTGHGPYLLKPRTDHACPQKPNPSRETVPLKTSKKVFCEEKVRLGILIKKF